MVLDSNYYEKAANYEEKWVHGIYVTLSQNKNIKYVHYLSNIYWISTVSGLVLGAETLIY